MAERINPQVSSEVAYEGLPGCMSDDRIIPCSVNAATSTCGYTLRWLISFNFGKRAISGARIGVRSRISTSASVSLRRSANTSLSLL